jgi:glycosyltransferase involved in cell wall biosynthesis
MSKCDFYISNSNFETFGMTIAEALIAGKPVISTLSGGPNEFLTPENSITVKKNNPAELSNAICKMSNTFANYNKSAISKNISKEYGHEVILQKLLLLYKL